MTVMLIHDEDANLLSMKKEYVYKKVCINSTDLCQLKIQAIIVNMRLLFILAVTVYACQALSIDPDLSLWNRFKNEHNRQYMTDNEEQYR